MKKSKAYIDIDGVVLDTQQGFEDYFKARGITYLKENCTRYNFSGNTELKGYPMGKVFSDIGFWRSLKVFDGVSEAIQLLKSSGYAVDAYTLVSSKASSDIINERCKVLAELGLSGNVHLGDFKPVFDDADLLIEDCAETVAGWLRAGSKAEIYLVDYPYNRDLHSIAGDVNWGRVMRCSSMLDAVQRHLLKAGVA